MMDNPRASSRPPPISPAPTLPSIDPAPLLAQERLLDAVAAGEVVVGTPDELAARFGVSLEALGRAMAELLRAGWIVMRAGLDGRLAVRFERRRPDADW